MRKKLMVVLIALGLVLSVTTPASAAKDPPLELMLPRMAAAMAVPTIPDSTVSIGSVSVQTTRIYYKAELSVPNTACWRQTWSKRFQNSMDDGLAHPFFWAEICWRNYVVLQGTDWGCYDRGGIFNFKACAFDWGQYGLATRSASGGFGYSFGYGWLTIHRKVSLDLKFSPGVMSGTYWENF